MILKLGQSRSIKFNCQEIIWINIFSGQITFPEIIFEEQVPESSNDLSVWLKMLPGNTLQYFLAMTWNFCGVKRFLLAHFLLPPKATTLWYASFQTSRSTHKEELLDRQPPVQFPSEPSLMLTHIRVNTI